MADEEVPEDQDVEEARRLKEAVARLGASLREESERLNQDTNADLPIAAAPRTRPDPRLDALADPLATLVELQETTLQRIDLEADLARKRDEETRQLANRALMVAVLAAVAGIVALIV